MTTVKDILEELFGANIVQGPEVLPIAELMQQIEEMFGKPSLLTEADVNPYGKEEIFRDKYPVSFHIYNVELVPYKILIGKVGDYGVAGVLTRVPEKEERMGLVFQMWLAFHQFYDALEGKQNGGGQ